MPQALKVVLRRYRLQFQEDVHVLAYKLVLTTKSLLEDQHSLFVIVSSESQPGYCFRS